jgi:glycosyltransferase involved in cell wall biosynthesis
VVAHNGATIFGGAERWTVRLLGHLQERGHRVLLLCRDESMAREVQSRGVEARVAHLGGHVALHEAWSFGRLLRRLRPDGLLLSTFKKVWLGGMGARLAGVPRVVARIGLSSDRPARRIVYRVAFRRWVHRIVTNSEEIRAGVLADLPEIPPERVATVYNGVDRPALRRAPGAVRAELGLAPEAPVVGAVARLAGQKRLDRLLRVVARLPDAVRCIVAGDGPDGPDLRELARSLGVEDRVRFLGHREDVGDVLDALDLFLLTSDREGMSNSMLEALAAGVPVVSTPVSGAREALDPLPDGRAPGQVVAAEVGALARAVDELLLAPGSAEIRATMTAAARARARTRFDWDDKVRRWEQLLARDVTSPVHQGISRAEAADPVP